MGNEFGHPEWIDFPRGDSYDNSTGAFVPGIPSAYPVSCALLLLASCHALLTLSGFWYAEVALDGGDCSGWLYVHKSSPLQHNKFKSAIMMLSMLMPCLLSIV